VNCLIKAGANLEVKLKSQVGRTPLVLSILNSTNLDVVIALIRAGANVQVLDQIGHTPLMKAVTTDHHALTKVEALLQAGAKPNIKDATGRTALDMAGMEDVIILLLLNDIEPRPH
jgi:ankyrin repeat protein